MQCYPIQSRQRSSFSPGRIGGAVREAVRTSDELDALGQGNQRLMINGVFHAEGAGWPVAAAGRRGKSFVSSREILKGSPPAFQRSGSTVKLDRSGGAFGALVTSACLRLSRYDGPTLLHFGKSGRSACLGGFKAGRAHALSAVGAPALASAMGCLFSGRPCAGGQLCATGDAGSV